MDFQDLSVGLIVIVIILVSLSVHEFAHAFVANIFGDPTAKNEGRLTVNPIAHWDKIGTTLLVGLLLLRSIGIAVPVFGWGKPVPVNEDNFENPRIQGLQVAMAGPISNFILAFLFALLAKLAVGSPMLSQSLVLAVYINIFLMFFNLIPVPPLDGSRILRLFISDRFYFGLSSNPIIFFVLLFFVFTYLLTYISRLSDFLSQYLLGI